MAYKLPHGRWEMLAPHAGGSAGGATGDVLNTVQEHAVRVGVEQRLHDVVASVSPRARGD
jgi:hypothetical protein